MNLGPVQSLFFSGEAGWGVVLLTTTKGLLKTKRWYAPMDSQDGTHESGSSGSLFFSEAESGGSAF